MTVGLVLVIGENEDDRDCVAEWFRRRGFRVASAASASEAPRQLAERLALIVIDAGSSDAAAREAIIRMRLHAYAIETPIFVLTAESCARAHAMALDAGATIVFEKPVACGDLLSELAALERGAAPPPAPASTPWRPRVRTRRADLG